MMDISSFFRVRENRLEIFVTGLSYAYTKLIKVDPLAKEDWSARSSWICDQIKTYVSNLDLSKLEIVLDCRKEIKYTSFLGMEIVNELLFPKEKVLFLVTVESSAEFLTKLGFRNKTDLLGSFLNYCYYYDNIVKENIDWASIEVDRPIISLSSRLTENRAVLTKDLLDLAGDRCRASFGFGNPSPQEIKRYERILHPYPIPLQHGTDSRSTKELADLHTAPGHELYKSLLAIVHETNDDDMIGLFITEKSYKAFAWHQIPIFVTVSGHAAALRRFGFDLFDDIIDHSYDSMKNPHMRRIKIMSIVSKFLKDYPTLESVQNLRKALWPRIVNNNRLLAQLNEERANDFWPYYG